MDPLRQLYNEIPPVSRVVAAACLGTAVLCQLNVISPFQLYFNPKLIMAGQVWRLVTCFLYAGPMGLDFALHLFFLVRYCKLLEDGSFRNRTADFCFMLLCAAGALLALAPLTNVLFLSHAMTFVLVYVWSRHNRDVSMSFLGVVTFSAPYLPWVLLGFTLLAGQGATMDLLGMLVGHIYYYLADFYPALTGRHLLPTPAVLRWLLGEQQEPEPVADAEFMATYNAFRPGGFDFSTPEGDMSPSDVIDSVDITRDERMEGFDGLRRRRAPEQTAN